MLMIILFEELQCLLPIAFDIRVTALEHVELSFLMPTATWTFRKVAKESLLPPRVKPPIHELGEIDVLAAGHASPCYSDSTPVDVIVVGHGFALVFLKEEVAMWLVHDCLLDLGSIVSCHPLSLDH